ncbi:VWA domain-containing protein [Candidatus Woesearchaeota archaeon]|nr:VWA domain-containing protein [Candidatus Woesearchaeota archaeon]
MASITFLNVHFLWLLFTIPLIIALHFFMLKYTKRRAVIFANFEALRRVTGYVVFSKNITLLIARVLVILFLILSASGMIFWTTGMGSEFDYVLAIDASSSMLADDLIPDRLTVAKETAKGFVNSNNVDVNIGVVSFSGVARLESPLSENKGEVESAIGKIKVSPIGGTDISGAIITSVNALRRTEPDKSMSVILLTDGQHTVGGPLEEGITYALKEHVVVHTIGIATEVGGKFELTELISTINEPSLQRISANTGGRYFRAGSKAEMDTAFNEILTLAEQQKPHQLRLVFLIIGLVLLFLEWVLLSTVFKTLP